MRVALKITLSLSLVFFVIVGLLGWFQALREVRRYEAAIAESMSATGNGFREAVYEVARIEGTERARQILERVDDRIPVRLRWATSDEHARLLRALETPDIKLDGCEIRVDRSDGPRGRLYVFLTIGPELRETGAIELSEPLDREGEFVRGIVHERVLEIATTFAAFLVLATLAGMLFVGRPVRALVAHLRRIGEGELGERVAIAGTDELAALASATNVMSERLAEARVAVAKETEQKLRAIEALRHADRIKTAGQLASGIAHELGTPLNVVLGRAKLVGSGKLTPDEVSENARIIVAQVDRISKIVRQLLDFVRRGPSKKSDVALRSIAKQATTFLSPLAKKRRVELSVDVEEGTDDAVRADAAQIEQVLTNLVVNALHATREGGTVDVRVGEAVAKEPDDPRARDVRCVTVDVRDSGEGIAPDVLPRIFEPFFTTKDVGEGTGLGLSVAYGIVRDHGGWIDVATEIGRGTTFRLYLPREPS